MTTRRKRRKVMGVRKMLLAMMVITVLIGINMGIAAAEASGEIIERDGDVFLGIGGQETFLWHKEIEGECVDGLKTRGDEFSGEFLIKRLKPVDRMYGGAVIIWEITLYYGTYGADNSGVQIAGKAYKNSPYTFLRLCDYYLLGDSWVAVAYSTSNMYNVHDTVLKNFASGLEKKVRTYSEPLGVSFEHQNEGEYLAIELEGGIYLHLLSGELKPPLDGLDRPDRQTLSVETEWLDGVAVPFTMINGQKVRLEINNWGVPYNSPATAYYYPGTGKVGEGLIIYVDQVFEHIENDTGTTETVYYNTVVMAYRDGEAKLVWEKKGKTFWIIPMPTGEIALVAGYYLSSSIRLRPPPYPSYLMIIEPQTGVMKQEFEIEFPRVEIGGINSLRQLIGDLYFTKTGDLVLSGENGYAVAPHLVEGIGFYVKTTVPKNGSVEVSADAEVSVSFSYPLAMNAMNPASFTITDETGGPVDFTVAATDGNETVFLRPLSALKPGMKHTVTVLPVPAENGDELDDSYEFSFTTAGTYGQAADPSAGASPAKEMPATAGSGGGCFITAVSD